MYYNNNSFSKAGYLIRLIYLSFITYFSYKSLIYREIIGKGNSFSKKLCLAIVIVSFIIGILLSYRCERNFYSLLIIVLGPYAVYTVVSYWYYYPLVIKAILVLSISWSSIRIMMLHRKYDKAQLYLINEIPSGFKRSKYVSGTLAIITGCMCGLMLYIALSGLVNFAKWEIDMKRNAEIEPEPVTIAANIDMISKLDEEVFANLDRKGKLEVFDTVGKIETYYLGIPYELKIDIQKLPQETLACYDDRNHIIFFNDIYFDERTAHELLGDFTHETRHAYQVCLCECYEGMNQKYKRLLPFKDVPTYIEEFKDYHNDSDFLYYFQLVEMDSRYYSEEAVEDYYSKISQFHDR